MRRVPGKHYLWKLIWTQIDAEKTVCNFSTLFSHRQHIFPLFILSLLLFLIPFVSLAEEDIGKELQKNLEQSKTIITSILNKLQPTTPNTPVKLAEQHETISTQLPQLQSITESIRISHLLLQERFKARNEKVKKLSSKASDRHEEMAEKYRKAVEEYLKLVDSIQQTGGSIQGTGGSRQATANSDQLSAINSLLNKLIPKKKRPILGSLPYKHLNYPAQEPSTAPTITPAYKGGDKVVRSEDTQTTDEAPISKEITALAQSLNWQPVAIYEYVKNNIETEWYWGCMKGAEETLRQKSGNDCDQATLLAALLRASGFPTRYVRGTIEFTAAAKDQPINRIKNLTGIDDPKTIAEYFQKAGIPYKTVIAGGTIANFQIEHIWVETQIPYANYRGVVIDDFGKTWLGLDTSIKVKGYQYNQPKDISELSAFSEQLETMRDEYLGIVQPDPSYQMPDPRTMTPLEYLQSSINSELRTLNSELLYADFLRSRTLIPEVMNIIPDGLQFKETRITNEYNTIPDELKHKVKLSAISTQQSADKLFEITIDTYKLSNQQIAISYEPETVQDQEIINSYGGLDNTPAYLIRLRPVLKISSQRSAVSRDGIAMGDEYYLTLELISPNGTEKTTNTMIVGNLTAIGIVAQKAISTKQSANSSTLNAESLLFQEAINYIDRWNKTEDELASFFHLNLTRPLPTVVTVGGMIDVTYLLDTPHGFTWKGVFVDAGLRRIETVASYGLPDSTDKLRVASERGKTFMQLSSLQGSVLENRIFEDDFKVDSISTAKLFQLTTTQPGGAQLATIDKSNIDTVLSTLILEDNIKEDIQNSVNQNLVIRFPQAASLPLTAISYSNWSGIGYIKENLETGESGWMLSGMVAGGMTALSVDNWPDLYLSILQNPYASTNTNPGPQTLDPVSGNYMQKIAATDLQVGVVGTELPKKLEVKITDPKQNPAPNIPITFTIKTGGGIFGNDFNNPITQITVTTNSKGVASASFRLGRYTKNNPSYQTGMGDLYPTQVGENIIDTAFASGTNLIEPFTAIGVPGSPDHIEKNYGDGTWGSVLSFAGFVSAGVVDKYDNPISNMPITFTVNSPTQNPDMPNCPWTASDAANTYLVKTSAECIKTAPVWGMCGDPTITSMTLTTDHKGAAVQVILGGMEDAIYKIDATLVSDPTKSTDFEIKTFDSYQLYGRSCINTNDPFHRLAINYTYVSDQFGHTVDAGKTDTLIPVQARMYFISEIPKEQDVNIGCGICRSKVTGTRTYNTKIDFKSSQVTFSGIEGSTIGDGVYKADYKLKAGLNTITISGTATRSIRKTYTGCPFTCNTVDEDLTKTSTVTMQVYGVDIIINPVPMVLIDQNGYASQDTTISYTITPAEYKAYSAYVMIYKNGSIVAQMPTEITGQGFATISRGFQFDVNSLYEAEVILNYGTGVEIKGGKKVLPVMYIKVSTDDDSDLKVDEIKFGNGKNDKKRYKIELQSKAIIQACNTLTGTIQTFLNTGQTVTVPGPDYSPRQYNLTFSNIGTGCSVQISGKDNFIVSNRSTTDLNQLGTVSGNTAVLYGGIGSKVWIEVNGAKKAIPIEPVGIIVLGIDGLRQDVLYPPELDKVQDGGKYKVDISTLPGLKQILGGYDKPAEKQQYIMLPEVTAIFPSITLASWASIFTGVQAGQTGILGNEFFDRKSGIVITFSDGAFKLKQPDGILERYPVFGPNAHVPGKGSADLALNPTAPTIYEFIKTNYPKLKTTTVMHNYSRGADTWLYLESFINKLRFAWNGLVGDEDDVANLMDSVPIDDSIKYVNELSKSKSKYPALLAIYMAGLDHAAHDKGMTSYLQFFKDNSDKGIERLVKTLQDADEFENKLFIIIADHGMTAMPTSFIYNASFKWSNPDGTEYTTQAPLPANPTCELRLDFADPNDPNMVTDAMKAEHENNNLHIWEFGEVMRGMPTGELTPEGKKIYYKFLAPAEIVGANKSETTTTDLNQASMISALNGPMAHIYIKGTNDWSADPQPALLIKVARLLNAAFAGGDGPIPRLASSVQTILVRLTQNSEYVVYNGATYDAAGQLMLNNPISISAYFSDSMKYVDALNRVTGMNHPKRSGDIVLIMKDETTGDAVDRYTTGVACKSWHGSLNPSDSYVPFIVSYPGGNKSELDPLIQKACINGLCEGNWKAKDLISEIIKTQYPGQ